MEPYTPFCGVPPVPAELFGRWLLDPVLLTGLAVFLGAGLLLAEDRRRFAFGWALVAFLFISPLCAASMALFSARVAQHILLTLIAAPMVASALPLVRAPAMLSAFLFAVLFWCWHMPAPYAATLAGDGLYWAMHISLFGAAVLLFSTLRAAPAAGILAAAFTAAQLTAFAALLTLSPEPWHHWHELTTVPYGLTALSDQQLAGALMWVAGGAIFLALVGAFALRWFSETEAAGNIES